VTTDPFSLVILMPVYRDWESASLLCRKLDEQFAQLGTVTAKVLLVDDGSPDGMAGWEPFAPRHLQSVEALQLRRNVGHQRAIAVGLCYLQDHFPCDSVVIMDADGEDRPEDVTRLVRQALERPGRILFAQRRRRMEGRVFRAGYSTYRLLHHVLTGVPVRVGNFSVLPYSALRRLTCMPELWNHYAGAVFTSRLGFDALPIDRGTRYRGQSHMNMVALVSHGLSGIASFQEAVGTRVLLATAAGSALLIAALIAVVAVRFLTGLAVPGWATYTAGFLLILLLQLVGLSFSLVFMLVTNRVNSTFLPARDYPFFVDRLVSLTGS
jgi:glycosyltransferase involved in cell wall biosynthesis